jgi:predicted TIM-barrel fold metal-dependent hydrolase
VVSIATQTFLGECYWPGITRDQLAAAEDRIRRAVGDLARAGVSIRAVSTTFIPADEVVLTLFEAASQEDVLAAGRRSEIAFDRVQPVEVSHFDPRGGRR